jgi:hypothetical protein
MNGIIGKWPVSLSVQFPVIIIQTGSHTTTRNPWQIGKCEQSGPFENRCAWK